MTTLYDGRAVVTVDASDGKLPAAVDLTDAQGVPGAVQTALNTKADSASTTTALDEKVDVATLAAVTINGVAPDVSGNYTIATGTGGGAFVTAETSPGSGLYTVSAG